ncbi:Transcription factor dbaG [Paramyrothecium foliicola]|nr:Transcription factor dbaG [Paramyrothecium foliicola]
MQAQTEEGDGTIPLFREYAVQDKYQSPPLKSIARKCTLPPRQPTPGSDTLPEDGIPIEVSLAKCQELAVRSFLYDHCNVSSNRNLSRSYLSSLESLVRSLGLKSDLGKACSAAAAASHGKSMRRPQLVDRAERTYQELLGSMAKTLQDPAAATAVEAKYIAMLLGSYQIVMPNERPYSTYDAHSKGLAALMEIEHSPHSLLRRSRGKPLKNEMNFGVFNVPALTEGGIGLDTLLIQTDALWTKFETVTEAADLVVIQNELNELEQLFKQWQVSRTPELYPTAAGSVKRNNCSEEPPAGLRPGRIDTYFDLYVAGIWNVFRSARLLIFALSHKLASILGSEDACTAQDRSARLVSEDILASIPYHLVDNLPLFLSEAQTITEVTDTGKRLGGLLLLHPLYILSNLSFIAEDVRVYAKTCLRWIGSDMGLGQATLLANVGRFTDYEKAAANDFRTRTWREGIWLAHG